MNQGNVKIRNIKSIDRVQYIEKDETSSEDDVQVYQSFENFLPPANQIIVRPINLEYQAKSIYKIPFIPTPQFNKKYLPFLETSNVLTHTLQKIDVPLSEEPKTLLQYYQERKGNLVYKRFPQLDLGKIPTNGSRVYFATLLVNFQKKTPKLIFREDVLDNQDKNITDQIEDQIKFESNFESGNLFCAFKVDNFEYDLIMQNDINTRGNTQWFYFSVQGAKAQQTIKFNIMNHLKTGSLFNEGLKPAVFSVKENEINETEWIRDGFDISYYRNGFRKEYPTSCQRRLYTLTFKYTFQHHNDTVYFAHSYPYTYSDLQENLNSIVIDPIRSQFFNKKTLCHSLMGNNCDVITITSNSLNRRQYRKGIVFIARQHPGEPQGSYVMQGVINYLTSPEAEFLRQQCIFKIFPMVNSDGVIAGNYRCGVEGNDLNRKWHKPNKKINPTVYFIKKYIKGFAKERQILLICDLHGHSRKAGSFFYGCSYSSNQQSQERVFALLVSKLSKYVQYQSCTFKVERYKDKTARIQLWRDLKVNWAYTYETSFFGQNNKHYTIKDYLNCGQNLCLSLDELLKDIQKPADVQKKLLEELGTMQSNEDNGDIGSDSSPSEAELSDDEKICLFTRKGLTNKQKALFQKQQQATLAQQKKTNARQTIQKLDKMPESVTSKGSSNSGQRQFQNKRFYSNASPKKLVRTEIEPPLTNKSNLSKAKIEMVDKAVQTDEWLYRDWLMQIGKNRRKDDLFLSQLKSQKDGFLNYTPQKQKLMLAKTQHSASSSINFLIKNSTSPQPNSGFQFQNLNADCSQRQRIDSFQKKTRQIQQTNQNIKPSFHSQNSSISRTQLPLISNQHK